MKKVRKSLWLFLGILIVVYLVTSGFIYFLTPEFVFPGMILLAIPSIFAAIAVSIASHSPKTVTEEN